MTDLTKLSDADLMALKSGDLTKMSDSGLFALKGGSPQQPTSVKTPDPSEGKLPFAPFGINTGMDMPQGVSRFLAGAGKGLTDAARGVGQLVGAVSTKDIDEAQKRDAPLMNTGAGIGGNVVGNLAAFAPTAMIPGANTIAGGAALGALSGAAQPVGTGDSRAVNAMIGGAAGAAIPAAITTAKALRAGLVDPFTSAGQTKIAGNVINNASNNPASVVARLRTMKAETPDFNPTVGQLAGDDGVASLERTMKAIDPAGFNGVDTGQRAALANAVKGIAGTPEMRSDLVNARELATNSLYDSAKKTIVQSDPLLDTLLKRPSMNAGAGRAGNIAAERGESFALNPGSPQKQIPTGLFDSSGSPIMKTIPAISAEYKGKALHDLKMGLDDAIGKPGLGGMQGAERNAALNTKEEYLSWLENKIPEYAQAKNTYADMSKPINQMDVGGELYNRLVPALADQGNAPFKMTAQSYANALRNGDALTRNVTGMKSSTLAGTMTPEQMNILNGVAKDAEMKAAAENAGRGVGSDTVQKISMSNIAQQAGVPTWFANLARVPGGWAKRLGDVIYGGADQNIREKLSDILKNPTEAAKAMEMAGATPSQIADFLKKSAQGVGFAAPAIVNVNQKGGQ